MLYFVMERQRNNFHNLRAEEGRKMRNKWFRSVLIVALIGALSLSFISCAAKKTIKIGAIFAITGPASYLGAPEEKTAKMMVEKINKNGGINGQTVELVVKDSAADSVKALSFAKQLIEEDNVVAIIGPSTSGESMAIKDLCEGSKVPLVSCAAAETIVDPQAHYVFKTPQKDSYVVKWIYENMKSKNITKIGVLASLSGFGKGGLAQLQKYAADYGITIVDSESYDPTITDLTALLTKLQASGAQAVVNWSIEPAQSIVCKNLKQLNMTIPLYQSHGFGNIKYVEAAGGAAEGVIFPCGRLLIAEELPDTNPQKSLLVEYKTEYETLYNEQASTFGGHAYDAMLLLKTAMEQAKSSDRDAIANQLEKITNLAGTAGIFNMSTTDHNGLQMDSLVLVTVKDGKFTLYK
jgi:branched-chain amino acid transport system substrate-binding protein